MEGVDINTAPLPPLVFFCSKCKNIVSDSTLFLFSVRSLNLLVVKGASGIAVDRTEVIDRPQQPDWRSVAVSCSGCNCHLGRVYKTITGPMAILKDLIALSVSTVSSYELGMCETVVHNAPELEGRSLNDILACGAALRQAAGSGDGGAGRQQYQAGGAARPAAMQLRVEELEAELTKVKSVMLVHNERLQRLEQMANPARKRPTLQDLPSQQLYLQSQRVASGSLPALASSWGVATPSACAPQQAPAALPTPPMPMLQQQQLQAGGRGPVPFSPMAVSGGGQRPGLQELSVAGQQHGLQRTSVDSPRHVRQAAQKAAQQAAQQQALHAAAQQAQQEQHAAAQQTQQEAAQG